MSKRAALALFNTIRFGFSRGSTTEALNIATASVTPNSPYQNYPPQPYPHTLNISQKLDNTSIIAEAIKAANGTDNKPIPGIPIPSSYGGTFQDTANSNELNFEEAKKRCEHLLSSRDPWLDKKHDFAGKVMSTNPDMILCEANSEEIGNIDMIVVPGLGLGSSASSLQNTLYHFQNLFPRNSALIYSPTLERDQEYRYVQGTIPYYDQSHSNEIESKNFFNAILKPRFFDKEGKLKAPEECKRLLLGNHSIASREAISHMAYLKKELIDAGCEECDIKKYLNKILCFNISSPLVGNLEDAQVPTIYCLSISDFGSKKPPELLQKVFFNPNFYERDLTLLTQDGEVGTRILAVMGPQVIQPQFLRSNEEKSLDLYGHGSGPYSEGMLDSMEVRKVVDTCSYFTDPKLTDEEALGKVNSLSLKAQKYPEQNEHTIMGARLFIETMRQYTLARESVQTISAII